MTVETWFYYIAIAYFAFAFLFLVALIVAGVMAYRKLTSLQKRVSKSAVALGAMRAAGVLPFAKLGPVLAALPFIFKLVGTFKKKR